MMQKKLILVFFILLFIVTNRSDVYETRVVHADSDVSLLDSSDSFDIVNASDQNYSKSPKYWSEWPILPSNISEQMKELYWRGIQQGNDPHAFSVVGDCQSNPQIFMGMFDSEVDPLDEKFRNLMDTIENFHGSFNRMSVTVRDGQSVASVLSPEWADPERCDADESPIVCEFRLHKPSIVFINLGTNWNSGNESAHADYLREIVRFVLDHGAVPILSSKGDNQEGGHRINRATAEVAEEFGVPFWNFWRTLHDLPGKGIDDTRPGGYLTAEGWNRHSYSGLQALDAVWKALSK
jgi:hypothetical protein